jgi:hypothetical protein
MRWDVSPGILNIAVNAKGEEESTENFVQNYGTITLEQVVTAELQHINGGERKTQDTYIMYRCLMASLISEAKKKIMIWQFDTNATTKQIRTKLSSLDTYVMTVDSDVGKFNQ